MKYLASLISIFLLSSAVASDDNDDTKDYFALPADVRYRLPVNSLHNDNDSNRLINNLVHLAQPFFDFDLYGRGICYGLTCAFLHSATNKDTRILNTLDEIGRLEISAISQRWEAYSIFCKTFGYDFRKHDSLTRFGRISPFTAHYIKTAAWILEEQHSQYHKSCRSHISLNAAETGRYRMSEELTFTFESPDKVEEWLTDFGSQFNNAVFQLHFPAKFGNSGHAAALKLDNKMVTFFDQNNHSRHISSPKNYPFWVSRRLFDYAYMSGGEGLKLEVRLVMDRESITYNGEQLQRLELFHLNQLKNNPNYWFQLANETIVNPHVYRPIYINYFLDNIMIPVLRKEGSERVAIYLSRILEDIRDGHIHDNLAYKIINSLIRFQLIPEVQLLDFFIDKKNHHFFQFSLNTLSIQTSDLWLKLSSKDEYNLTLLDKAVFSENVEIIELLLTKQFELTPSNFSRILNLMKLNGNNATYQQLIKQVTENPEIFLVRGNNLFHLAAESGSIELFDLADEMGMDINQINDFGYAPLSYVVDGNTFRHFLSKTNNPGTSSRAIIHSMNMAKPLGSDEYNKLKEFLLSFTPLPQWDTSKLHIAVTLNDFALTAHFLEEGIPVNNQDEKQRTPLYFACGPEARDIKELLLYNGGEVTNDRLGISPEYYCQHLAPKPLL
ncbi:hypothetical protein EOPP23_20110 [Endozoicomonas sp. OPT23]|uniref:hypothetical protein n=1 Tax=Endozoicomonas sp. OPT23 TaxID=2072845 RepID=UPI00129BD360|nr:hypothetical protein [Endozoicomonas sp. OPT23]MRI35278.1 hypothetical protein [Endozoicomonas sp. OPT23]